MLCARARLVARRTLSRRLCSSLSDPLRPSLPTLESARSLPRHVMELSNEQLFVLAEGEDHNCARREMLRREIMAVDGIEYDATTARVREMSATCASMHTLFKAPYQLGIASALLGGWASLPLVFHFQSASLFNDYFVTADPPDVGDADTWLEVGSWSWNWMEPPLGTISFFLLCMQFAREQRVNIGIKPFTERLKQYQADTLAAAYPQYNNRIVRQYAESVALQPDTEEIADDEKMIAARLASAKARASS